MNHQSWNDEMPGTTSPDMGVLLTKSISDAPREEEFQQKVQGSEQRNSPEYMSLAEKHGKSFSMQSNMQTSVNCNIPHVDVKRRLKDVSQLQDTAIGDSDDVMLGPQEITLYDSIDDVRVATIEALGTLDEAIPIIPLLVALRDPYWDVRAAAAQALGKLGTRTPIKRLIVHLKQETDMSVREAIVRVLGQQSKAMPIDVIVGVLLNDESWLVRETAAWALGQLEEYAPLSTLIYALRSDLSEFVRAAVATALGKTKRREAMESLFDALEDPDSDVRNAASFALQQLDEEVIEPQLSYNDCPYNHLSLLKDLSLLKLKERFTSGAVSLSEVFQKQAEWKAFSRLREYIGSKRGGVEAELKDTDQGRVILFQCFYECPKESLQETLLPSFQGISSVESIEAVQQSRDDIVQTAVQKALEIRKSSNLLDLLVVSFSVSCAQTEVEQAYSPLRVIVCSMGCRNVRKHDVLLDQFSDQWHNIVGESICERIQDLADLKIWCQPVA